MKKLLVLFVLVIGFAAMMVVSCSPATETTATSTTSSTTTTSLPTSV